MGDEGCSIAEIRYTRAPRLLQPDRASDCVFQPSAFRGPKVLRDIEASPQSDGYLTTAPFTSVGGRVRIPASLQVPARRLSCFLSSVLLV